MLTRVTDVTGNRQDKIYNAAKAIGSSAIRHRVFEAICFGKLSVKTVQGLAKTTGLTQKQILVAGAALDHEELIHKEKVDGRIAYKKDPFYSKNRGQILKLARNPNKLGKFPSSYTPHSPKSSSAATTLRLPKALFRSRAISAHIEQITIDTIDSFRKVRSVRRPGQLDPIAEAGLKIGILQILSEKSSMKDWGGETEDIFSTRLLLKGKRRSAAFALKGMGTRGRLTPKMMGKRGDQIQRLFRSPAEVFLIQYWGEIDASIIEQMRAFAFQNSATHQKPIYYGVIDGADTCRLLKAYQRAFITLNA
ncbi:MAG: hypothetical protein HYT90_05295 [Candidatus Omnitrophica bacterium]|nr:hypothetical protein [Candidatus Omnitrophota bacterium]